jgi:hypothetical protein
METLQKWNNYALAKKQEKQKNWTDLSISTDTYNNIKFSVSGFLAYCKDSLTYTKVGFYIPMLWSNTSSLEALFAQIQTASVHSGTSLLQYNAHLKSINVSTMNKSLKLGHTYKSKDAEETFATRKFETKNAKKQRLVNKKIPGGVRGGELICAELGTPLNQEEIYKSMENINTHDTEDQLINTTKNTK